VGVNASFQVTIGDVALTFETTPGLFSPGRADPGTLALLSHVQLVPGDHVLDLGCGYGLVGIWCARMLGETRVAMCDRDPEAVRMARLNAERNKVPGIRIFVSTAFRDVPETGFTLILSNPPYHEDFSVAKEFIEKGFNRLAPGGRMMLVTKRREWYRNKLVAIFGGVRIHETDGYLVFEAEKRSPDYAPPRKRLR
jgi:16S rRNA (guanine1207-N2)-methyltransferase